MNEWITFVLEIQHEREQPPKKVKVSITVSCFV